MYQLGQKPLYIPLKEYIKLDDRLNKIEIFLLLPVFNH